jgi:hypothetical protein
MSSLFCPLGYFTEFGEISSWSFFLRLEGFQLLLEESYDNIVLLEKAISFGPSEILKKRQKMISVG